MILFLRFTKGLASLLQVISILQTHASDNEVPQVFGGRPPTADKDIQIRCRFGCCDGAVGTVGVYPAPIKTAARMREKLHEFHQFQPSFAASAGEAENCNKENEDFCCGQWPTAAGILDPVRVSVVVSRDF